MSLFNRMPQRTLKCTASAATDNAAVGAGGAGAQGTSAAGAATAAPGATGAVLAAAGNSPAPSAVPGSTAGASPDWTQGFNEDLKGYIGNKGFKSPTDLAEAYRGAEKLIGVPQDRVLKLPEKFYDESGKLTAEGRAIRERIGAPKDPKDYNLTMPKEGGDPKLTEHFRGLFHELGLPKSDAEKIQGAWNTYVEGQTATAKEMAAQAFKDQQQVLSKEWGAALDQNTNLAKDAVRTMGLTTKQVDGLAATIGHVETMKLLHKLGSQVREAPFIGGSRSDELLVPANAKAQINELKSDKSFGKLLESGDRDARAKWENLHKQAYPGDYRI